MIVLTVDRDRLARDYAAALRSYLSDGGEAALASAYELGRQAAASGIGVVELVSIHDEAVGAIGAPDRATPFLLESLSPYEMSHRGFREACERLQAVNRSLEAANRELEAFSYSVSHDLRAPLRAISGYASILVEDFGSSLPEEGLRFLKRVKENGDHMGHLIDDLLAFSRLGRQALRVQRVHTRAVVDRALAQVAPANDGPKVELVIGDLPDCDSDSALLEQVFVNLLGNAFKYSGKREGAHIVVGAEQNDAANPPVFFVKDNGVGFDMQYVDKLFGVFQRLHRNQDFEGTGVGLAIVQRIVSRHGGRVWAEGKVNEGATFYFTLSPGGAAWQQSMAA